MKLMNVLFVMIAFLFHNIVEAQITVRNKQNENPYPEKMLVYDSLNNFGFDKFGIIYEPFNAAKEKFDSKEKGIGVLGNLYNQFIGQRIMILPKPEQSKTKMASNDEYADLRGKYFTIVDVSFQDNMFNTMDRVYELQDDDGDRTEWIIPSYKREEAILLGFYEKLRSLYVDSVFVYTGKAIGGGSQFLTPKLTHSAIDSRTNDIVSLNVGDKWTCSDFQIVDDDVTVQLYAVFYNKKGNEILVRLKNMFKTKGELDITFFSCFVKESEFEARKKMLTEKYGEENANLISLQQVAIGMTKEMCHEAWDTPDNVNKTVVDGIVTEQWIYPKGSYLYFTDGILTEAHKEY
ncbi:MAG: hypothetical protein IKM74_02925 [Bacteroidales bacterium]|nr:hypothetical protein [Bacteroidales bacterium]